MEIVEFSIHHDKERRVSAEWKIVGREEQRIDSLSGSSFLLNLDEKLQSQTQKGKAGFEGFIAATKALNIELHCSQRKTAATLKVDGTLKSLSIHVHTQQPRNFTFKTQVCCFEAFFDAFGTSHFETEIEKNVHRKKPQIEANCDLLTIEQKGVLDALSLFSIKPGDGDADSDVITLDQSCADSRGDQDVAGRTLITAFN